jgi:hypothetical protein
MSLLEEILMENEILVNMQSAYDSLVKVSETKIQLSIEVDMQLLIALIATRKLLKIFKEQEHETKI